MGEDFDSGGFRIPGCGDPILVQHYVLLERNLIYAAVTRGKKLVVIVGSKKAMAMGINNDKTKKTVYASQVPAGGKLRVVHLKY